MSVSIENVNYTYNPGTPDEHKALDNVSFKIEDGVIAAFAGRTGSGKSTMMQQLNGLLRPDSGKIYIGDLDITGEKIVMRDVRRRVGLVFQYPEYQLFEETVALDVAYGPKNLGLSEDEVNDRVEKAIRLTGLDFEKVKNRSPFELSGGQKRRVAIAGVIAMEPEVLILDEPTAGLDPAGHRDILEMIKEIHRKQNNIIIFVSHNMQDIASLADQVVVMEDSKLLMQGTPAEVFSKKEELEKAGLSVPPVAELMHRLKKGGLNVDTNLFSCDEAVEEIAQVLISHGKHPEKQGENMKGQE